MLYKHIKIKTKLYYHDNHNNIMYIDLKKTNYELLYFVININNIILEVITTKKYT